MAGWCMNIIVTGVERLNSMPPFVRALGGEVLAAYGPAAFPCGMLSLWDPCVAFISGLCDEERDSLLLRQLADKVKEHVANESLDDKPALSHAAACGHLAKTLLMLLDSHLDECTANLDAAQKAMATADILRCCHGDAGPGAGKTRTLVARLAYLYRQGVTPERIVLVTFTNKAVAELRSRVRKARLPVPPRIVTLDSFVISVLGSVCREAKELPVALLWKDEAEAVSMGEQPDKRKQIVTLQDFVIKALVQWEADAADKQTKTLACALTDTLQKAMQREGAYWSTADQATMMKVARSALDHASHGWFSDAKDAAAKNKPLLLTLDGGKGHKRYIVRDGNVE
jgi:hypothetical protein